MIGTGIGPRAGRVAVVATPFGFGPSSKAFSIGRVLTARYDLEVRYFGSACARDFFAAQGAPVSDLPSSLADTLSEYDAVVNVLAPELIPSREVAARTHYVDSLGFMWQQADLPLNSRLRQVRAYYAQDVFGSVENLTQLGFPDVIPVPGITGSAEFPAPHNGASPSAIVNLGGLINPAGARSAQAYLPLVRGLINGLGAGPYKLTVAMNLAAGDLAVDVPVRQLSVAGFRAAMQAIDVVYSSPGMTTLVESSQAGRTFVPLPPQNWSQVVIAEHMLARSSLDIWRFLTEPYLGIDKADDEMRKAAAVREVNLALGRSAQFAGDYVELALAAAQAGEVPALGAPYDGADKVAAAVVADLSVADGRS